MKTKTIYLLMAFLCLLLSSAPFIQAQEEEDDNIGNLELAVFNETSSDILIQLFPMSMVFNGYGQATLVARGRINNGNGFKYNYINGNAVYNPYPYPEIVVDTFRITPNGMGGWNDDMTAGAVGNSSAFGNFGYGIYKIIIKNLTTGRIDSALIENDYWQEGNFTAGTPGDIYFYLNDDEFTPTSGNPYRFYYEFERSSPPLNNNIQINYDSTNGYYLRSWKPNGVNSSVNARAKVFGPTEGMILQQFGNAGLDTYSEIFPYDARLHCDIYEPSLSFIFNQNSHYPLLDSASNHYEDRNGIIPLDLTIKRRVSTSYSRSIYSYGNPSPTLITVIPGVTLSILRDYFHDNPAQGYPFNGIVLNKYGNENIGNHLIVKGETSTDTAGKIILGHTYGNDSNARIVVRSLCKFLLEPTAILDLGQKNEITVEDFPNATQSGGEFIAQKNSIISTSSNSRVTVGAYSKFVNNGANITNANNFQILVSNGGKYVVNDGTVDSAHHIVNNGANIEVINANLTVGNNSKITFDGSSSYLKLDKFATVTMGQNAKIIFKNGAYLLADSTTFKAINSEVWEGLVFENTGSQTDITNCKFYNAKNPVSFYNDSNYVWIPRSIVNTTFNLPTGGQKCIYAENVFNLLIQNDSFQTNSGTFGLHVRNTFAPWEPMHTVPQNSLNITNNYFKGGTIGMALMNFDFTKYYVYNNRFIGTDNGYFGIITKKVSGTIKENKFANTNINQALRLDVSNIDLFGNIINGNQDNINVLASTTVNMRPIINGSNYIWQGGINLLTSSSANNIAFSTSGLPLLDYGKNCFTMSGGSGYHMLGTVHPDTTPSLPYYCRGNSWSHIVPNRLSNIRYIDTPIVPIINPGFSCSTLPEYDDFTTFDMGLNVYDTVWSTEITEEIPELDDDENLYNGALYYIYSSDYVNGIYLNKSLIDNYAASIYINDAIWNMYACYNQLDTGDATLHDNLFSELKTYLTDKINSNNYGEDFESAAYQAILLCETELDNFNTALDGYEFLTEYHPDPVVRINASWDYEDLALLLGEGGSQKSENLSSEEYRIKRLKRLNKIVSGDPVLQKLKESYDKTTLQKYNKTEATKYAKKTISESDRANIERKIYTDNQQKIIQRSLDNIRFGKNLSKEQKDKRLVEDLIISAGMDATTGNKSGENIIPTRYELHQNYPNPFNPATTIKYQIPKDGLVQIKVYDIIGREVMTLVNEQKSAGTYETVFNATSFASGIYFYKIQSGSFVETKRMMLIK